jgi:hypothetical protein
VAKTDPIPVRFTEGQAASLKRIAAACGVGEQDVARWAVEALGAYWQAHGERLLLPLDFSQRFSIHSEPMILHEPPKPARAVDADRMNKRTRRATALG